MQITISLQQDSDAPSCNWHEIAEILYEWSARHATKNVSLPAPSKGTAIISLDVIGHDLTFAIQELHGQLYDHQVNFTVLPF